MPNFLAATMGGLAWRLGGRGGLGDIEGTGVRRGDGLPLTGAGGEDEALQEAAAIGEAFAKAHHEAEVWQGFDVEDVLADDVSLNLIRQGERFRIVFEKRLCCRGDGSI